MRRLREVVVASGKGGTGKTFVAANLAYYLASRGVKVVAVDADAEAPDLLLALGGSERELGKWVALWGLKARVDYEECTGCLRCAEVCAFHAVEVHEGRPLVVEEYCEGCGACALACPASCVRFAKKPLGVVRVDSSRYGITVVTAELEPGARGSGELVYEARKEARRLSEELGCEVVVVDAAAGIGCAVISSLAGADYVVLVCEPTPPSLQGAKRLLKVAEQLGVRAVAIVNKWSLSPELAEKVGEELGVEVLGSVPYDPVVPESYAEMTPLLAYAPTSSASKALLGVFKRVEGVIGLR